MADSITIVLTGVANVEGEGRQSQVVNHYQDLTSFLKKYGDAQKSEVKSLTDAELAAMAKEPNGAEKVKDYMAKKTAAVLASGSTNKSTQIVAATCNFLEREHGFTISEKDPGDNVFYIASGDISPAKTTVPGDGDSWYVTGVAPFG